MQRARQLAPVLAALKGAGMSARQMSAELTNRGIPTPAFTVPTVRRIPTPAASKDIASSSPSSAARVSNAATDSDFSP
jgi:hypothetical protein